MSTKTEIGARLREERERLRLSQTAFAARAGTTQNTQYLYEKGERTPDGTYFAEVVQTGVDILYVLSGARSSNSAISPREVALLDNYRASPPEVQSGVSKLLADTGRALERAAAMQPAEEELILDLTVRPDDK